jgi:two-component system response regulator NreC
MRILVVDDNQAIRRGVTKILSTRPDLEVCGEAKDGTEAIQKAQELQPDLILLDISMPGLDGLATARILSQTVPQAKILIMSQHDPVHVLPGALQAGADGCLDKSRLGTDLLPAIGNSKPQIP